MSLYNLWLLATVWGLAGHIAMSSQSLAQDPQAPPLTPQDQRFLSRVARRTYDQFVNQGAVYATDYIPTALQDVKGYVLVTLYTDNHRLGKGTSGPGGIVRTTIEATLAAFQLDGHDVVERPKESSNVLIEIEAIGPEIRVEVKDQWMQPGVIERFLELGVDGFTLRCGDRARRVCPSELINKNLTMSDTLKTMAQAVGGSPQSLTLWRFRTKHWYQSGPGRHIVPLHRGLTIVTPDQVTLAAVNRAIDTITEQLLHRQRASGLFAYEYEPAAGAYSSRDNPVHQAGAAWALAATAATSQRQTVHDAAARAIETQQAAMRPLPGVESAACVTSQDQRNKLGLTAQVLLAMAAHPRHERFQEDRARLASAILWLQKPTGQFVTAFPPARRLSGFGVYPSLALLALLEQYRSQPDQRILQAFNKAHAFYTSADDQPSTAAAAWLIQPFARMAVVSNRKEFARFAYRLADRLIEHQLDPRNCQYPELYGSVRLLPASVPDINTAVCLSAWLDALQAARRFGHTDRAAKYLGAAEGAARFTLQLQIRKAEVYYMRLDRDTVGGVRTSVADNRIRLENLQYALLALIKYRDMVLRPNG
ncbi:MAG: hypothetical protein V3W34_13715 [Phycisphaerae bacterium]